MLGGLSPQSLQMISSLVWMRSRGAPSAAEAGSSDRPSRSGVAEEQRRYELTLQALKSVDEGKSLSHEEVLASVEQRKRERREWQTAEDVRD